jgi:hypothetical protein
MCDIDLNQDSNFYGILVILSVFMWQDDDATDEYDE